MSEPTCETCRWWVQNRETDEASSDSGECRRHPPTLLPMTLYQLNRSDEEDGKFSAWDASQFPETGFFDWCGEHQPRKAE